VPARIFKSREFAGGRIWANKGEKLHCWENVRSGGRTLKAAIQLKEMESPIKGLVKRKNTSP